MCSNGVNIAQFDSMIDMADDHLAVGYRWTHKMAHMVDDGGFAGAAEKLQAVQGLLADARALLDDAKMCLEDEASQEEAVVVKRV